MPVLSGRIAQHPGPPVPLGRWVVERTFGWIMKHRRCVRDYERLPDHHETYLYWSMIPVMTARLARRQAPAPPAQAPALARPTATVARTRLQAA